MGRKIFLTLAVFFVIFLSGKSFGAYNAPVFVAIDYAYQDARDFHEGLAAVKQDGRWGYIDPIGRVAIPFVHRVPEAGDFSEGFAFVGDHYIDTEGRRAFTYIDPDTDEQIEKNFTNGLPFSQGLAGVQIGGQWGYIDLAGNFILPPTFERVGSFSENLAPARKNNLWGYIDMRGNFVIEPKFSRAGEFHEGKAAVYVNGRWGFIDTKGNYVIKPAYSEVGFFSHGLAPVKARTSYRGWGFVNSRGKFSIPRRYNKVGNFGDDLAPAAADMRWGFLNSLGEWEILPQFDEARSFSEGLAAVKRGKLWGYIRQ